jgi:hypothetical protein
MRQNVTRGHQDSRHHAKTIIRWVLFGAAGVLAILILAAPAPADAASVDSRFDVCAALRNGTSLASIETALEARGYSARNAGALTGTTIRQQCPDQAAGAMAQVHRAGA